MNPVSFRNISTGTGFLRDESFYLKVSEKSAFSFDRGECLDFDSYDPVVECETWVEYTEINPTNPDPEDY